MPKTHVALLVVVSALMFGAIGFLIYPSQPSTDTVTVAQPLNVCSADAVRVFPTTESGVTLFVDSVAPNVITIDVWDAFHHRRLSQQVTMKGSGARFSMWGDFMYSYRKIDVTERNGGTCTVGLGVLRELNQAHGWK